MLVCLLFYLYSHLTPFLRSRIFIHGIMTINTNKSTCLTRAQEAMSVANITIEKKKKVSLWGRSNKAKATIACLQRGDKTLSIIAIAGDDASYGKDLFQALRKGMSDSPEASTCSISGRATGARKEFSREYRINLYGPTRSKYRATTTFGSDYRYRFSGLPEGQYWIVLDTRGDYGWGPAPSSRAVNCKGNVTNVDFNF